MTVVHSKLIVVTFGAIALFWPSSAESPLGAATVPSDAVRIEHQLIRVSPAPPPRQRPRVLTPANRLASHRTPQTQHSKEPAQSERKSARDEGPIMRAGRLLIGDGRYRPEPFPSVKNEGKRNKGPR